MIPSPPIWQNDSDILTNHQCMHDSRFKNHTIRLIFLAASIMGLPNRDCSKFNNFESWSTASGSDSQEYNFLSWEQTQLHWDLPQAQGGRGDETSAIDFAQNTKISACSKSKAHNLVNLHRSYKTCALVADIAWVSVTHGQN